MTYVLDSSVYPTLEGVKATQTQGADIFPGGRVYHPQRGLDKVLTGSKAYSRSRGIATMSLQVAAIGLLTAPLSTS